MLNCITVSILSYFPLQIHALRRARGGYIYIYIHIYVHILYVQKTGQIKVSDNTYTKSIVNINRHKENTSNTHQIK